KTLEAHGLVIPEGGKTDSTDWLGKAAYLDLELSEDEKYINVKGVSKLDPEEDTAPTQILPNEHWEGADGTLCPSWASWAVAKSTDLSHYAPPKDPAKLNGKV